MRISEAGHDRATVKIDNFRGMKPFRVAIRANENDSVCLYRHRFALRLLLRDGVNVPVRQKKIDIFSACHSDNEKSCQKENQLSFSCRIHRPSY
jgi:hypothetical protein